MSSSSWVESNSCTLWRINNVNRQNLLDFARGTTSAHEMDSREFWVWSYTHAMRARTRHGHVQNAVHHCTVVVHAKILLLDPQSRSTNSPRSQVVGGLAEFDCSLTSMWQCGLQQLLQKSRTRWAKHGISRPPSTRRRLPRIHLRHLS